MVGVQEHVRTDIEMGEERGREREKEGEARREGDSSKLCVFYAGLMYVKYGEITCYYEA